MHFRAPFIIRDGVSDDVTGALVMGSGCVSHSHLPEEEWRVLINLSCYIFGQQPRLEFDTATIARLVSEDGMFNLFSEPLFEFREEDFASLILETIGPQFHYKISRSQHAMIQDVHHHRIDDAWPEFFQQVKSQSWSSIEGTMQVSDKVVEAHELHRTRDLVGQQCIPKTQQGVHRIGRRTLHTSWERPLPGVTQELAKAAKVGRTSGPLHAKDSFQSCAFNAMVPTS